MISRKILISLLLFISALNNCLASGYSSIDRSDPITLHDGYIVYRGVKTLLDTNCIFVDNNIDNRITAIPYVYNSVREAFANMSAGTEDKPMIVLLAPGVYWIDDPDDETIRRGARGSNTPFGMTVDYENLHIKGLSEHPCNVVLASNRGQMQGAMGNFTMFNFRGNNLTVGNLTMSNYCNVDLVFPLDTTKNRPKRTQTITQSQIAFVSGRASARNCIFISRLNACPLVGNGPVRFNDCYIECGDDALCGSAYYNNCEFGLFSSKPFYNTWGTGAIFNRCVFNIYTKGIQCFTKQGGQLAILNSKFCHDSDSIKLLWSNNDSDMHSCFEYNNTLNGKPLHIGSHNECLSQKLSRENADGFINIGNQKNTYVNISPAFSDIETDVTTATLKYVSGIWCDRPGNEENITWSLEGDNAAYAAITHSDNNKCTIKGMNETDSVYTVMVKAVNESGLCAYAGIRVKGKTTDAPVFKSKPRLSAFRYGSIKVSYTLSKGAKKDNSVIKWYRCSDKNGTDALMVATSRMDIPEYRYLLKEGDEGYFIMAEVTPGHKGSYRGEPLRVISKKRVTAGDILNKSIYTDFRNFPSEYQPSVMPGTWTVDSHKPIDTKAYDWIAPEKSGWHYGCGIDGAAGSFGLQQSHKGARLMYTPAKHSDGNMGIYLCIDPCKPAGQGFGSPTGQYMDICIKFDSNTLTGYGLRIERSASYDKAVVFKLIRYDNGIVTDISEEAASNCFVSTCRIEIFTHNGKLHARASTTKGIDNPSDRNINMSVNLEADFTENSLSGIQIQHTGSVGASAAILKEMFIEW